MCVRARACVGTFVHGYLRAQLWPRMQTRAVKYN